MNAKLIQAPALDIDARMAKEFDSHVGQRGKIERKLIANLIAHMAAAGWHVHSVYDGEGTTKMSATASTAEATKAAMELIFNLDEASLRFAKDHKGSVHGVLIVLGNDGYDAIADWNYADGDPDGFNAAMEAFDTTPFEKMARG